MRLDKFLWFVRLTKTRALAQALVLEGKVRVNGMREERGHRAVRVGDILTLALQGRARVLQVEALPTRRGPAPEAQACYVEVVPAIDARPTDS